MSNVKLSDVLMCAFEVVVSRDWDVDSLDGTFATCGTGEIIRLDEAMSHYFNVGSDDLNVKDVDSVLKTSKEMDDHLDLIAKLRAELISCADTLDRLVESGHVSHHPQIELDVMTYGMRSIASSTNV